MSNKSEATWPPNSAPMTYHTDLIARLNKADRLIYSGKGVGPAVAITLHRDLRAALACSVTRESYRQLHDQHEATRGSREKAERECDEARAERDLIVREVKDTTHASWCIWQEETRRHIGHPCDCYLADAIKVATAPAVSLARHDAEVKAQALDEQAEALEAEMFGKQVVARIRERAAAIRAEAE